MTAVEPELAPLPERTISDVETLKALSDPVRLRILETMVQAPDDDWTVKRIAAALNLSIGTVKGYVSAIFEKLGVEDRTQAALLAAKHDAVTPPTNPQR